MRRMNARISYAINQYQIAAWTQQMRNGKFALASTVASRNGWHTHVIKWVPAEKWRHNFTGMPHRKQGRSATPWDDDLQSFVANILVLMTGLTVLHFHPKGVGYSDSMCFDCIGTA